MSLTASGLIILCLSTVLLHASIEALTSPSDNVPSNLNDGENGQLIISSSSGTRPENKSPEIVLTDTTTSGQRSQQHNTHDDKMKNITSSINDGYKVLIIIRGPSGSGKSHLANSIVESTVGGNRSQFVFSTDDYFVMLGRGVYQFDASKLNEAHNYTEERALNALMDGVSPVIIDNTNTRAWEMQPYVVMGVEYGYMIEVLEPNTTWFRNLNELVDKNQHGVPKGAVRRQMERYEHNITGQMLIEQFSLHYSPDKVPPQRRRFPLFEAASERLVDREFSVVNHNSSKFDKL